MLNKLRRHPLVVGALLVLSGCSLWNPRPDPIRGLLYRADGYGCMADGFAIRDGQAYYHAPGGAWHPVIGDCELEINTKGDPRWLP